jgi:hypothetical protein
MPDPTKQPHQDNPENPNEDLSDERQRQKAKREDPRATPRQAEPNPPRRNDTNSRT